MLNREALIISSAIIYGVGQISVPALGTEINQNEISLSTKVNQNRPVEEGDTVEVEVLVSGLDELGIDEETVKSMEVHIDGALTSVGSSWSIKKLNGNYIFTSSSIAYTGKGSEYTVELWHKAINNANHSVSTTGSIQVAEVLSVDSLKVDTTTINIKSSETQSVKIKVTNETKNTIEAGELELSMSKSNPTSKDITLDNTKFEIPSLKAGESKEFMVKVTAKDSVTRGLHDLIVKIQSKNATLSETIKLKVDSEFMPPSLEVKSSNNTNIKKGETRKISFSIKNVGAITARNLKMEVVGDSKVSVMDGSNVRYIESIDAKGIRVVDVALRVDDDTSSTIPVQLKFTYTDELGNALSDMQTIYLTTATETTQNEGEVFIENIIEPTGTYTSGEQFTIKFTVRAKGDLKNTKLNISGPAGIIPKTKNVFVIPELKDGEKQQFSVTFMATSSAADGIQPIEIKATTNGTTSEVSQYATVLINNPEKEENDEKEEIKKGTPKVIIGQYSLNPSIAKAGSNFELNLGFLNTHNSKGVYNLKATLVVTEQGENGTGSVFTPINASNTFYIASMAPGQATMKNLTLYTIPSAQAKTYQVNIEMEYEDENGNEIKVVEKIGIPVEQVTSLEIADFATEVGQVGIESYLSIPIYNTGKTDINNLKLTLIGDNAVIIDGSKYIGTFEKGKTETFEPVIIPNQSGMNTYTIVAEYETVTGENKTLMKEFVVEAIENMIGLDDGMFIEEEWNTFPVEEDKSNNGIFVKGIIGAGLIGGITGLLIKRRKKKKEEQEVYED